MEDEVKIKIIRLISAVAMLGMAGFAWADIPLAKGPYAEGNIGIVNQGTNSTSSTWYEFWGANVNVGYKFIPFAAAELGYTTYGTSQNTFTGANAVDLTSKIMIPFQEMGLDIFGKLGIAVVNSQSNLNLYYGFGGEYAFNPNSMFVVQWAQANNSNNSNGTGNLWLFSVGINFIFGNSY